MPTAFFFFFFFSCFINVGDSPLKFFVCLFLISPVLGMVCLQDAVLFLGGKKNQKKMLVCLVQEKLMLEEEENLKKI